MISLMGGRLNKAVQYDAALNNVNQVTYQRYGYGLKFGYENNGNGLSAIIFRANDVRSSLDFEPINSEIRPQENMVYSLIGKTTLWESLSIDAEYALSALTQNLDNVEESSRNSFLFSPFLNQNGTTDYFQAIKSSVNYKTKFASFALKFEHIDPNYRTLGGYFFNNDLQNYTFAPSFRLFKGKMNLALNTGFQRNNLSGGKSATTRRWIGSANMSFTPFAVLSFNASYSNFSSFTRNRLNTDPFYFEPADTMNFYQVSQNASFAVISQLGKKESRVKHSIMALYNLQESLNLSGSLEQASAFGINVGDEATQVPTVVHSGNVSYTVKVVKSETSISVLANMNQIEAVNSKSLFFGPSLNIAQPLFNKKVSVSLGSTYNQNYKDDVLSNNVFNHRLSVSHSPKLKGEKLKMTISLNGNYMQKLPILAGETTINELNAFANVGLTF